MEKRKEGENHLERTRRERIRRESHQICGVTKLVTKSDLNLTPGKRGKLKILQGQNTGRRVRGISSGGNVKEIEVSVTRGNDPKDVLQGDDQVWRLCALTPPG